jgi:hypothetical protein
MRQAQGRGSPSSSSGLPSRTSGYFTGNLKMDSTAVWLVATLIAGRLADSIGRRNTHLIDSTVQATMAVTLLWLVNTATLPGFYAGLILM